METRLLPLCKADCECSRGLRSGFGATLQHVFGFSDFRPGQLEAIFPALHGQDAFVRMVTGAGKSLYVQLLPHLCTQAVQLGWSSVPWRH